MNPFQRNWKPSGVSSGGASKSTADKRINESTARPISPGYSATHSSMIMRSGTSYASAVSGINGTVFVGGVSVIGSPSESFRGASENVSVSSLVSEWRLVYGLTESPSDIQAAAFEKMRSIFTSLETCRRNCRDQLFMSDFTIALNTINDHYRMKYTYDVLIIVSFFCRAMAKRKDVLNGVRSIKSKPACEEALTDLIPIVSRLLANCFASERDTHDTLGMIKMSDRACIEEVLNDTQYFLSVVLLHPQFHDFFKEHSFSLLLRQMALYRAALLTSSDGDCQLSVDGCFPGVFVNDILPRIRDAARFSIDEIEQLCSVLKILSKCHVVKDQGGILENFRSITADISYSANFLYGDNFEAVINTEIRLITAFESFSSFSEKYFTSLAQSLFRICALDSARVEKYFGPHIIRLSEGFSRPEDSSKFLFNLFSLIADKMLKPSFDRAYFHIWEAFGAVYQGSEPFQRALISSLPFRKDSVGKLAVEEFLRIGLQCAQPHDELQVLNLIHEGVCEYLRSRAYEIAKYCLYSFIDQATDEISHLAAIINIYAISADRQFQFVNAVLAGIQLAYMKYGKPERLTEIVVNFMTMVVRVMELDSSGLSGKNKIFETESAEFREVLGRLLRAGVWSQLISRQVCGALLDIF